MSIRVLVVDDEPLARLGVAVRLGEHPDMEVIGESGSAEDAARCVLEMRPDLMFLDIQMPGLSGLEVLRILPPGRAPCAIFLTAHAEFAVEAFGVEALDYLLKPVDGARFSASLERVRRLLALRQQAGDPEQPSSLNASRKSTGEPIRRFVVRQGNEIRVLNTADVDWIEGLGDYAGLHVRGKTYLLRQSLTTLVQQLDPDTFFRVHRSAIIQLDRVHRLQHLTNRDLSITLQDGTHIRGSRTYSVEFLRLFAPESIQRA